MGKPKSLFVRVIVNFVHMYITNLCRSASKKFNDLLFSTSMHRSKVYKDLPTLQARVLSDQVESTFQANIRMIVMVEIIINVLIFGNMLFRALYAQASMR